MGLVQNHGDDGRDSTRMILMSNYNSSTQVKDNEEWMAGLFL
jgi:hypothetical protein